MQDRLGDKVRLQHILDAIGEIEDYTKDVELEEFKSNSMMFNASIRQLEIVGEASNRLSDKVLEENKDIPWARIVALRNLAIHEYFGIDYNAIWLVIRNRLPELKGQISSIVGNY